MHGGGDELRQHREALHRHLAGDVLDIAVFHIRIEEPAEGKQRQHEPQDRERIGDHRREVHLLHEGRHRIGRERPGDVVQQLSEGRAAQRQQEAEQQADQKRPGLQHPVKVHPDQLTHCARLPSCPDNTPRGSSCADRSPPGRCPRRRPPGRSPGSGPCPGKAAGSRPAEIPRR